MILSLLFLRNLVLGSGAGALAAFLGYLKREDVSEKFDVRQLLRDAAIGGLVGGVAAYYGISMGSAWDLLATSGGLLFIERGGKFLWRGYLESRVGPVLDRLTEIFRGSS